MGTKARPSAPVHVDLPGLATGWHRVDLDALGTADALGIALETKKTRGRAEDPRPVVSEVAATASELPQTGSEQRIVVSYPHHIDGLAHRRRDGIKPPARLVEAHLDGGPLALIRPIREPTNRANARSACRTPVKKNAPPHRRGMQRGRG